ncbi:hypothetical protein HanXRQr2_Chr16g0762221 [Helianthus annuus]|uniref:Uncharacterized protein n=1 Tax=Helianthus annuus TaxID=4232 RepID=A0A9K3DUS4_HELAN|nr:hypothetical protein HanXRQr2_Chr16g0762221 [Helianthus annuus]
MGIKLGFVEYTKTNLGYATFFTALKSVQCIVIKGVLWLILNTRSSYFLLLICSYKVIICSDLLKILLLHDFKNLVMGVLSCVVSKI